mmetsp:Transcript_14671/g.22138  ORF Transcript_14671/g.22138 Transcript_14671/m.22138 type:complete len:268 (-) Transcript_14671:123-926(-)
MLVYVMHSRRMNDPKKLNGWTEPMMRAVFDAIKHADSDDETKAVILTGTDPYYCAGVNLSGTIKLMHPKKLFKTIVEHNQSVFDTFLDRKKPMLVAINGPAIGACVTSATLCDAVIASEKAKFLTPFGRLGITPEGCSSFLFYHLIGNDNARRMLHEDWEPTATEAKEIGLITDVVPHDKLMDTAQSIAEKWVQEERHLQPRSAMGYSDLQHLKEVNARESVELGHAFLSEKFLSAQVKFLESKGKSQLALIFKSILYTRPAWSKLL